MACIVWEIVPVADSPACTGCGKTPGHDSGGMMRVRTSTEPGVIAGEILCIACQNNRITAHPAA